MTSLTARERLYVVEPRGPHSHTLILLHGLGSNGEKFGTELLDTGLTSSGHKLPDLLPGARFVFPTSKRRRSTAFGRSMLTQWFDIARLTDPLYRKERQLDGLAESAREILDIMATELQKVQPQNLIIGGLSQGCAMSLAVLLSLEHPIGGYIGMSGFLTYQDELEDAVQDDIDSDDPFTRPSESRDAAVQTSPVKAQVLERDLLSLPALECPSQEKTACRTPVFLGHGMADERCRGCWERRRHKSCGMQAIRLNGNATKTKGTSTRFPMKSTTFVISSSPVFAGTSPGLSPELRGERELRQVYLRHQYSASFHIRIASSSLCSGLRPQNFFDRLAPTLYTFPLRPQPGLAIFPVRRIVTRHLPV